jgi:hypothetical protein
MVCPLPEASVAKCYRNSPASRANPKCLFPKACELLFPHYSSRAMTRPTILLAATLALLTTSALGQVVYLNDQFTDGDRINQSLPSSGQWTFGAHPGTGATPFASLDATSGSLVWDHSGTGNSFSAIWSHFTDSGSPITLAVGETITLTFNVSFSVGGNFLSQAGGFRFALFNSNGSRTTTDFASTNETGIASGTTFNGWRGYEGQTPISNTLTGTDTNDFLTRERTGSGAGLFSSANWTPFSSSAKLEPLFASATIYDGSLSISRTGAGTVVQASINGVTTNSVVDATAPFVAYDTVAFFVLDGVSKDVIIDNVNVSVVPEPSSCCLLGAAALGLVRRRRK